MYVALLRGINVGGNRKVDMKPLRVTFEHAGMDAVRTYINSGNIIFESDVPRGGLTATLESAIQAEFDFEVKVILRNAEEIAATASALPNDWANDATTKCDVMFLADGVDSPKVLERLAIKPEIDDARYVPGAILWRVDRPNVTRSGMMKIVGTELYAQMTVRNCNTLRKLAALME